MAGPPVAPILHIRSDRSGGIVNERAVLGGTGSSSRRGLSANRPRNNPMPTLPAFTIVYLPGLNAVPPALGDDSGRQPDVTTSSLDGHTTIAMISESFLSTW